MAKPIPYAMDTDSRTLTRLLYTGAVGFLFAAEATHERHLREPSEPEHYPAICVNACYAAELSLKAFLASRGEGRKALKAIGHDLAEGYEAALAKGYQSNHPAVSGLIDIMSPLHITHSLRYLEDISIDIPETRNMIAITRHLVLTIGKQIPITDINIDS